jgi:ATP-binding cassette subfamily B protein
MQEYGVGDLLSRATSDFIYIWRFYSAGFQMSMHALLLLLIGTALMAWSNLLLAGLVLVMLTVSLTAQFRLSRTLEGRFTSVQREMGVLSAFTQEHLASARMLAVYNQEAPAVATFRRATDRYTRRNLDFLLRSAVISPLPALFVRLAQALVLLVGGTLIIQDRLTLGQYTTFVVYLGLLNSAAMQLSGAYERLLQGSAAAGRIGEILHRGTRVSDAPDAGEPPLTGTLRFEGVGVREGRHWVLRQIDVEVPAGTTLGIVGATGAGKSTLLGLVGRIRDPDEGRVTIDGHDVRRITLAALRRAVVYVPQETLLFSMPLRDNITLGLDGVPDERVQAAARVARLTGDLAQLPRGLDTIVGERGATLSGGQKQRTAIARAIVRDPRILLMDDSLSAVDTETAAGIIAELRAGAANTRLIVSQRLAAVRDAEQIIVLDEGRIVERGTHASLLHDDGLYAAMYRREVQQAADELDEDRAAADD